MSGERQTQCHLPPSPRKQLFRRAAPLTDYTLHTVCMMHVWTTPYSPAASAGTHHPSTQQIPSLATAPKMHSWRAPATPASTTANPHSFLHCLQRGSSGLHLQIGVTTFFLILIISTGSQNSEWLITTPHTHSQGDLADFA